MSRARIVPLLLALVVTAGIQPALASRATGGTHPSATATERCAEGAQDISAALGLTVEVCPSIPALPSADAPPAETPPSAGTCLPITLDRCEAWVSQPYDGPGKGIDRVGDGWTAGNTVATSPDGAIVFAAGQNQRSEFGTISDVITLALDATTGQRLWAVRYTGPEDRPAAVVRSIAAGPAGVYVTGYVWNQLEPGVGFTVAYEPRTGEELWEVSFPGIALASAISDDGSRVFVTGEDLFVVEEGPDAGEYVGAVTVAYDAETGLDPETEEPMWVRSFLDVESRPLVPWRMDSAGDRVTIAASRIAYEGGATVGFEVATFDATGPDEGRLVSRVQAPANGVLPAGMVMNGDGSKAFVTHASTGNSTYTVAVDTEAGAVRWATRFSGVVPSVPSYSLPWYFHPIDISPDGRTVYLAAFVNEVFGYGGGTVTLAYDAATGSQRWLAKSGFASNTCLGPCGPSLSVNPTTGQVVVASNVLVVNRTKASTWSYDADGNLEWMHVSGDLPEGASVQVEDAGTGMWSAIAHSPDGRRVFVGGQVLAAVVDANSSPDALVSAFDTAA